MEYSTVYTVESRNKGHFRMASFVVCKEVVLFRRLKMYWNYTYIGRNYFGNLNCVLSREGALGYFRSIVHDWGFNSIAYTTVNTCTVEPL